LDDASGCFKASFQRHYTSLHSHWTVGHGFFLLSVCLLIVDKNITGASPMISSATDVTCSVVKKAASEANMAAPASGKVVFIMRINSWLPDGTSFESNVTTFKSNMTTFATNVTSSRAARREVLYYQRHR